MSRTKKRITTPLIHEKGGYVHRVRRLEDEDAQAEVAQGMAEYYDESTMDEDDWEEFFRRMEEELEAQYEWEHLMDEEENNDA